MKRAILILPAVTLALLLAPHARAAEAQAAEPDCSFNKELSALGDIRARQEEFASSTDPLDTSTSTKETLLALNAEELSTRQSLMAKTADCAIVDAKKLRDAASAFVLLDTDAIRAQKQLLDKIQGVVGHYELAREAALADTATIAGLKKSAGDLLAWRAATFAPLAEIVKHFIVWANNEALIETAEVRLAHVRQALQTTGFGKQEALQIEFERARTEAALAAESHLRARQGFERYYTATIIKTQIQTTLTHLQRTYAALISLSGKASQLK